MIKVTRHYLKRYKQRVTNSLKHATSLAEKAYSEGQEVDEIKNDEIRELLEQITCATEATCKVYRGYIYWFLNNTVLTVYSASSRRHRVEGVWL